jgi:hypothetical protein
MDKYGITITARELKRLGEKWNRAATARMEGRQPDPGDELTDVEKKNFFDNIDYSMIEPDGLDAFTNFLGGVVGGVFGPTGNLRDYQHANRLYVQNSYSRAPKFGFLYFHKSVKYITIDSVNEPPNPTNIKKNKDTCK